MSVILNIPTRDENQTGFINVKWFGARGDGTTDDTVPLQNAITYAGNQHSAAVNSTPIKTTVSEVFLPGGVYIISAPLNIPANIKLLGQGVTPYNQQESSFANANNSWNSTVIKCSANFAAPGGFTGDIAAITLGADNTMIQGITVDGIDLPYGTWWTRFEVLTAQNRRVSYIAKMLVANPALAVSIADIEVKPFFLDEGNQVYQLQAGSGVAPFTWSITSGSLPAGLSLSSNGLISGTPTAPSTNTVTFQCVDSVASSVTKALTVRTLNAFIVDADIFDVTQGSAIIPYAMRAKSVADPADLTWSLKYAPTGMVINSATGEISGTVTGEVGDYSIEIALTCNQGAAPVVDTRRYSVKVIAASAGVTIINKDEANVQGARINTVYPSFQFRATGGGGGYTWSIDTARAFPIGFENQQGGNYTSSSPGAGMTLSSSGVLSGTPTASGRYNFYIKAQSDSDINKFWIDLVILEVSSVSIPNPKIKEIVLPTASVGVSYSGGYFDVTTVEAAQPYTYRAIGLATGLSVNASTGQITGTPVTAPVVHGISLAWTAQIRDCQIRGFRRGAGIFARGATNLHRVHGIIIARCDIGINLRTQVYDSHWEDGYILDCRIGINLGGGVAAHNFHNYRIEFTYEDGVVGDFCNENAFIGCYWDECGYSGLKLTNAKNLIISGCRFMRQGKFLRGVGNPLNTGVSTALSNHIYLSGCTDAMITGNVFSQGSGSQGNTSETGVRPDIRLYDNLHPQTCLYLFETPGLTLVGNVMSNGSAGNPIVFAGGSTEGIVIRDNSIQSKFPTSTAKDIFDNRPLPKQLIINGDFKLWGTTNPVVITPSGATTDTNFTTLWNCQRGSNATVNQNITLQRFRVSDDETEVPCFNYLKISKPLNTGASSGAFQLLVLKHNVSKYVWELSGKSILLSFYARSNNNTVLLPRLVCYPATAQNSYASFEVYGGDITLSPRWQRYSLVLNYPNLRGLQVGKDGNPINSIQFLFDDGSVAVDADITGVQIELANENPVPSPYQEIGYLESRLLATDYSQFGAGQITASDVAFSPAGGIAATTVQEAIAELDSEKVGLSTQNAFTNTTATTSPTTGGATFAGGVGVAGDIRSGGSIFAAASAVVAGLRTNDASGTNAAATSLIIRPGYSTGNATSPNIQFITGNAGSSGSTLQSGTEKMRLSGLGNLLIGSTTDNAVDRLQVAGSGLFAGQLKVTDTTSSTSTTTGAVTIAGGLGIAGQLTGVNGVFSNAVNTQTVRSNNSFGTNVSGQSLNFNSGNGTGTGALAPIIFSTPETTTAGTGGQLSTERMRVSGANLLIGTTIDNGNRLRVAGNVEATQYRLSSLNTAPSSATDTGTVGEIRVTSTHIFACIATNTWVRAALSTW